MRQHKSVDLGAPAGQLVIVKELDAAAVWKLLPLLGSGDDESGLFDLLQEKWPDILPIVLDCIKIPENTELGFGDIEKIAQAFYEVNQPFFNRAGQLLGVDVGELIGLFLSKSGTSDVGVMYS